MQVSKWFAQEDQESGQRGSCHTRGACSDHQVEIGGESSQFRYNLLLQSSLKLSVFNKCDICRMQIEVLPWRQNNKLPYSARGVPATTKRLNPNEHPEGCLTRKQKGIQGHFQEKWLGSCYGGTFKFEGRRPCYGLRYSFEPLQKWGQAQKNGKENSCFVKTAGLAKKLCLVCCALHSPTNTKVWAHLGISYPAPLALRPPSSAASSTRSWQTWSGSTPRGPCRPSPGRRSASCPTSMPPSPHCAGWKALGAHLPQVALTQLQLHRAEPCMPAFTFLTDFVCSISNRNNQWRFFVKTALHAV